MYPLVNGNIRNLTKTTGWRLYSKTGSTKNPTIREDDEEFRVLDIMKKRTRIQRKLMRKEQVQPPRADKMPTEQNWGNVWPGPRSFHPASVPLPMRQGYVPKGQAPPGKYANAELMKVPNFLHLTPPVIKTQCEALKQFCTEWPKGLDSEDKIEEHYPIEVISSDYCHASPSIRNPLARIVSVRVKLDKLQFDERSKDKFLRLVGDRYEPKTDLVTIVADRCPVRKQNLEYAQYLLTACHHESWHIEDWEKEKGEADMEKYIWDNNASKRSVTDWYLGSKGEHRKLTNDEYKNFDLTQIDNVDEYKTAVSNLLNEGESEERWDEYKKSVQKLLNLPISEDGNLAERNAVSANQ